MVRSAYQTVVTGLFVFILSLVGCGGSSDGDAPPPGGGGGQDEDDAQVMIHFLRADETYGGWGLHLWGDGIAEDTATTWTEPRPYDRVEDGAAIFEVPVVNTSEAFNFIVHLGDIKSPDADLSIVPDSFGFEVWVAQDQTAGTDPETGMGIPFNNRADAEAAVAAIGNRSAQLDLSAVEAEFTDTGLPEGWTDNAAFMEIYVRGYQDSNGDGVGDFQGLIERLDYLAELGIQALWLMPVTQSSDNDHGYAVSDYRAVESDYGTMEDFEQLLTEAHERDIAIIMDYVINHSSNQNPLFQDAASAPDNDKRDWYVWRDSEPSGWEGYGGDPWHNAGNGWYYGVFTSSMPDFNLNNERVVEYHQNNLRFWLNKGVDGFRFDAVGALFENGPTAWEDQPENHPFMGSVKALIEEYEQRYLVCESPEGFAAFARANSCGRAFNFAAAGQILETARRGRVEAGLLTQLRDDNIDRMPLILANHDAFAGVRVWDQLNGDLATYRLAAETYLLSSATPFTYYGEEIGVAGADDLEGDQALRTPMSWTGALGNAGFTTGEPFRSLSANTATHNVEQQRANSRSLWHDYQTLYDLRKAYPVLTSGTLDTQSTSQDPTLILRRTGPTQELVVAINYSDKPQTVLIKTGRPDAEFSNVYGQLVSVTSGGSGELSVQLPAQSTGVWVAEQ